VADVGSVEDFKRRFTFGRSMTGGRGAKNGGRNPIPDPDVQVQQ